MEKVWQVDSNGKLFESLKSARKKYEEKLGISTIDELSLLDPSKTFKYTEKICELYHYGISKKEITNIIQEYEKYCKLMDNSDITNKTYNEIVSDINIAKYASEHSIKHNKEEEKKRNLIYNHNNIFIYKIDNFYDAYIKGKGTHWCISVSEQWYIMHKYRQEDFLFIYNKNLPDDNPNSKLCITIKLSKGECEITNKDNETYKENSEKENNCLNELGIETINFITDYINKNYNL